MFMCFVLSGDDQAASHPSIDVWGQPKSFLQQFFRPYLSTFFLFFMIADAVAFVGGSAAIVKEEVTKLQRDDLSARLAA